MRRIIYCLLVMSVLVGGAAFAQDKDDAKKAETKKKAPPPALVALAPIKAGSAQPMTEFIGTIYYSQVSKVASEVSGRVESVRFEEGRRTKEGKPLVMLNSDLLDASIKSTRASHQQVMVDQKRALRDLKRIENLYREESVAESVYDEYRFKAESLARKADALGADLERLAIESERKTIRAPFDAIVIEKSVERGEWVAVGEVVAVLARDAVVDAIVDVPMEVLGLLKKGQTVTVSTSKGTYKGKYWAFVPRGDVATRSFSVKVRFSNSGGLVEGMEARVMLPSAKKIQGLMVSRDAVINKFGMDVIFVSIDGKAKMVPVKVIGYHGLSAGVKGPGLAEGMQAVVKGNERIRDGQALRTAKPAGKPAPAGKGK